MRSLWVFALTLLALLAFDGWGQSRLHSVSRTGEAMTAAQQQCVEAGDWAGAQQLRADTDAFLRQQQTLLAVLTHHDRLDLLQQELEALSVQLARQDRTGALLSLARLRQAFAALYGEVRLCLENLL